MGEAFPEGELGFKCDSNGAMDFPAIGVIAGLVPATPISSARRFHARPWGTVVPW
jgi:hypothetical protein